MLVVQVLGALWMVFFHGVESQTHDEMMAERRKHALDDDDESEELERFAYNFTMREKDFWTCSHGYWGTYSECRCAHPLPDKTTECDDLITDMCIHRPNWACDPRRCIWDLTNHPDGIGFCRIKCQMDRKDLGIIQKDQERKKNYCPKSRCQWHMKCDDSDNEECNGTCKLHENVTIASMLEDEFNQTRLYPELDDQMTCTRHRCSVMSMIRRCHHYLEADQLLMFKRKCQSVSDEIAALGIPCEIDC